MVSKVCRQASVPQLRFRSLTLFLKYFRASGFSNYKMFSHGCSNGISNTSRVNSVPLTCRKTNKTLSPVYLYMNDPLSECVWRVCLQEHLPKHPLVKLYWSKLFDNDITLRANIVNSQRTALATNLHCRHENLFHALH